MPSLFRNEGAAFAQIKKDGVGLGNTAAVLQFEQGHTAVGILGEKIGRARQTGARRIILERQWNVQLARQKPHFVAISGNRHVMQNRHAQSLKLASSKKYGRRRFPARRPLEFSRDQAARRFTALAPRASGWMSNATL